MENKNLFLVVILSIVFLFGWEYFVVGPQREVELAKQAEITSQQSTTSTLNSSSNVDTSIPQATDNNLPTANNANSPQITNESATSTLSIEQGFSKNLRIAVKSKRMSGSISLIGGRIDDISLEDYTVELDKTSDKVTIFRPSGTGNPYYADFGWVAKGDVKVPDAKSLWQVSAGKYLSETTPVTITWDNGQGQLFSRTFKIDENFLITITQSVKNTSSASIALLPYGLIARHGTPETTGIYILHEGPVGVMGEAGLQELAYDDMLSARDLVKDETKFDANKGWLGFTDKYFASALIPDQNEQYSARFFASGVGNTNYQTDYLLTARNIAAGGETSISNHLFVGAKEDNVITAYRDINGFEKFDLLIDWGIFYFITKPLFWLLNLLNAYIGNFGFAILGVTIIVKALFYPLASKSYASMGKMKKLQPKIAELKERYKDDRTRQQQAQMELFKTEKVNPMAGCWPMLLQIPVFFALYKVLYIAIEMRQAPFFGWIQDLSAPDPTSVFNLFGLIPISLPDILMVGIWPILMGITQFVQMRLNPAPTDKIQAMVFGWMPVFFTFLLASFPAGMVIYWTWSNFLGVIQQAYIMKKNGVEISLVDNIKSVFVKSPADKDAS